MAATLTETGGLTYVSFPITGVEKNEDGDLLVLGKATDGTVDSDGQIVDQSWSQKALQEWFDSAANVRVQHQAQRDPAGKGMELTFGTDGHYVKSLIVEPVAKRLVEKGILTAYSVGIARPVIEPDITGKARNGIIKGGTLVELSLVDRPANKNCGVQLVKMADDGPEWVQKAWGTDLLVKSTLPTAATSDAGVQDAPEYEEKPQPGTGPSDFAVTPDDSDTEEIPVDDDVHQKSVSYKSVSIELPEDVSVAFSPADLAKLQTFARQLGAGMAEFRRSADEENAFLGKKHRKFSASRRRNLASSGNALPDGCVSGETEIATRTGPRRIDSLLGQCEVLTDAGWAAAEIRSFGVKPLQAVVLERDGISRTVYATSGHRWLTADGRWMLTDALVIGDRIPQVEVSGKNIGADSFDVTQGSVTSDAEKSPEVSGLMVMVDLEPGPGTSGARVRPVHLRDALAYGASSSLADEGSVVIGISDAVFTEKHSATPCHPSAVSNFDLLGAGSGTFLHAEPAISTTALAPDVEFGVRTLSAAGPASDRTFVLDRHPVSLSLPGAGTAGRLAKIEPSVIAGVAPSVHGAGSLRGLSAVNAGFEGHASNTIPSLTWEVTDVHSTSRCEEVYCAIVPDLHRFALADGILTGNSYPIPDADALRRAAILARSGHGNVSAARRLIARRAKELGVANPLSESDSVKKDEGLEPEFVKTATCDMCKGTGMIDGQKCMKCAGMKSEDPDAEKGLNRMDADDHDTDSDADADDKPQVGKGASPAAGVVGMHTDPLPAHREPDGAAIESMEHDAGLPTVPDSSVKAEGGEQPEMQAALRLKSLGVPPQLGMLHDMTCPAYSPEDIAKAYPDGSFASIDVSYFAQKAMDAAAGQPLDVAARTTALWNHAQSLKNMTLELTAELQAEAHKAFRDANPGPGSFPTPGHISPQRFSRGPITAGHAAESPGRIGETHAVMPSGQLAASQFGRGFISDGHAADSPANKGTGVPERVNYVPTIKDVARSAMRAMHDHVAQTFPDVCCCGPEEVGSIASRPVPTPQGTPSASSLKDAEPDLTGAADPVLEKAQKKLRRKMGKKILSGKMTVDEARAKIGRRVAQKAGGQSALGVTGANAVSGSLGMKSGGEAETAALQDALKQAADEIPGSATVLPPAQKSAEPEVTKAGVVQPDVSKMVSELQAQIAALKEESVRQNEQVLTLLNALAEQPDPSLAPYRGVAANPVKTASARPAGAQSVAEIAERTQVMMLRELENQWRNSPDPAQREAAWRSISKMRGLNP